MYYFRLVRFYSGDIFIVFYSGETEFFILCLTKYFFDENLGSQCVFGLPWSTGIIRKA